MYRYNEIQDLLNEVKGEEEFCIVVFSKSGASTKHLNITLDELEAIRDMLYLNDLAAQ